MQKLSDAETEKIYGLIVQEHKKYLQAKGIKLPNLRNKAGDYTKDALVLVKLAEGYPDTKPISKQDLTAFMKLYYSETNDVQQARHLGAQKGFNIVSGRRGDADVPLDSYWLKTLQIPSANFVGKRRAGYSGDFEKLKVQYAYRCATCGSKEGALHFFRKGAKVQLQKGHMDSSKPLVEGNIIPQCQFCNRADRNRWIYDKTGRVIGVAITQDGFRIVMDFLKRATQKMRNDVAAFLGRK